MVVPKGFCYCKSRSIIYCNSLPTATCIRFHDRVLERRRAFVFMLGFYALWNQSNVIRMQLDLKRKTLLDSCGALSIFKWIGLITSQTCLHFFIMYISKPFNVVLSRFFELEWHGYMILVDCFGNDILKFCFQRIVSSQLSDYSASSFFYLIKYLIHSET